MSTSTGHLASLGILFKLRMHMLAKWSANCVFEGTETRLLARACHPGAV